MHMLEGAVVMSEVAVVVVVSEDAVAVMRMWCVDIACKNRSGVVQVMSSFENKSEGTYTHVVK